MSSEWLQGKLGEFIELKRGYDLPQAKREPGEILLVSSSGITDKHSSAMVKGPGVVTGRYGTLGQVFYIPEDFWPLNTTLYVKDFKGNDPKFIHYFLKTIDFFAFSDKAAVPGVNRNHLHEALVNVAPLKEQIGIARVLGDLDDRITLLRETNATLEAMAQALFKSWFVDFDPVQAKQQGCAPEGMDAATAALFPDSFEESELGMVPKGWRLVPFGECLSHTIGGDWGNDAPDESNDTRVAIIRGTDIPDLHACSENRVPIRFTTQKKLKNRELKAGDIVIEVSGGSKDQPTGRSILITEEILSRFDCPVEPASFCRLFRPSQIDLSYLLAQQLIFIYAQGKTWEYQNQSTGIANFQTTHFLDTELVAIPTEDVLKKFCEIVVPLVAQMNGSRIRQLTELRDTLLPRLISGQLRLPEAQALVEPVV
ncbi:restriction endonuclease subunit S [Lampropedia aestuarii]|uniref:Restriction endonuclease subunit S n=1 Tax=Lampropedia aestuarii TaxID=2562762 RepID=A0A4S5BPH3_9BURK|nr:restriction endonuclease subunit S [Lampropedia aestuarii]THJ34199.1 restriction endonuclease subunit S [Lampropedia aestuarii]